MTIIKVQEGWHANFDEPSKESVERNWQESELLRTDSMLQPDRPNAAEIINYRAELRAYNNQPEFPDGVRPKL